MYRVTLYLSTNPVPGVVQHLVRQSDLRRLLPPVGTLAISGLSSHPILARSPVLSFFASSSSILMLLFRTPNPVWYVAATVRSRAMGW